MGYGWLSGLIPLHVNFDNVDSGIHYDPGTFTSALMNKENRDDGWYANISEDHCMDARASKKVSMSEAKYKMMASDLTTLGESG